MQKSVADAATLFCMVFTKLSMKKAKWPSQSFLSLFFGFIAEMI